MTNNILRKDGIYVQIGNDIWESDFFKTNKCWYNLMKITDDNKAIMLGRSGYNTFYEIYDDNPNIIDKKFRLVLEDRSEGLIYDLYGDYEEEYESYDEDDNFEEYCLGSFENRLEEPFIPKCFLGYDGGKSYNRVEDIPPDSKLLINEPQIVTKPFYDIFGLENHSMDILDIVKYFEKFDWSKFYDMPYHRGIEIWDISYPNNEKVSLPPNEKQRLEIEETLRKVDDDDPTPYELNILKKWASVGHIECTYKYGECLLYHDNNFEEGAKYIYESASKGCENAKNLINEVTQNNPLNMKLFIKNIELITQNEDSSEESWESTDSIEEKANWIAEAKHTYCNDKIYLAYVDNPKIIYAWGSLTFSEMIDERETTTNNFGFYFVPFDLNLPKATKIEYQKWRKNYQKFLNKIK